MLAADLQTVLIVIGSAITAVVMVQFAWWLAKYAFFGGDDAERAHAKKKLINTTTSIWLIMIIWLLCSYVAGLSVWHSVPI